MTSSSSVWDKVARDYHKVSKESVAHQSKISRIASAVLALNPESVLDLGCGSGVLEQELDRRGFGGRVQAIDSSREMISIAEEYSYHNKNIYFEVSDIETKLPDKRNAKFDVVVSVNVIFCLKDRQGHLKKVRELLNRNARLLLVSPQPVADNKRFFEEQLAGKGLKKLAGLLKIVSYAPAIFALILFENTIAKTYGRNAYPSQSQIIADIEAAGFRIDNVESIQAGQNFFIHASINESV